MNASLLCVINSCTLMTYGSRQRHRKSQAPQPRASVAPAVRSTARCRRAIGGRLFHLSSTGISLLAAGAEVERASRRWRIEVGVHGEAAAQFDPAGAVVRICQKALDQRSGQPCVTRVAATRARSCLTRSRPRHALFSWSIVSIVCYQRSWPKPIKYWCRINAVRSQPQGPNASDNPRR
jgi:hypothetical protein